MNIKCLFLFILFFCGGVILQGAETVPDSVRSTDSATVLEKVTPPADGSGHPFDPFNFDSGAYGNFLPAPGNTTPPEIEVKGIIITESGKASAILEIPGKNRPLYVQEGHIIRVVGKEGANETHLKVKSIREHEVEIIPLQNPEKTIIIR